MKTNKKDNMTLPNFTNPTVMSSNDNEIDEIPKNSREQLLVCLKKEKKNINKF